MAELTIKRLSQSKNRFGSYSYKIINGTAENETKIYGENEDILYSSQKIGIWNRPIEVTQFLGKNKETGKTYNSFSIDKELNSFTQRGHTASLAVKSGLDTDKISMLKMLSELDEQEMRVMVIQKKLNALPVADQPKAANPSVQKLDDGIEEAEILETEEDKAEGAVQQ